MPTPSQYPSQVSFKYRALTANCGNTGIGDEASKVIFDQFITDKADFYVLNCQEADFKETLGQLKNICDTTKYVITCPGQMRTLTKGLGPSANGITTFIIHKKEVTVSTLEHKLKRRNAYNFLDGSVNKGGMSATLQITKNQQTIKVETISGHLDSFNASKRSKDWLNLNILRSKKGINNWQELVHAIPHLSISGYDANTRNVLNEGNVINPWKSTPILPEMEAFKFASLGGNYYSNDSTYKTHISNIENTPEAKPKRQGLARGGSLDFVAISDGSSYSDQVNQAGVINIPSNETGRDHDVIISPIRSYTPLSDFNKVKGQIATRLAFAAPDLAQKIQDMNKNEEANQEKLLTIYQLFLSKDGLLNKMIGLQAKKQACFKPIKELNNKELESKISQILFSESPWFKDLDLENIVEGAKKYRENIALTQLFISMLNKSKNKEEYQDALTQFNGFKTRLNALENALNELENQKKFPDTVSAGRSVLAAIIAIAQNKSSIENPEALALLTRIAIQCTNSVESIKEGEIPTNSEELLNLSTELSHSSLSNSKNLALKFLGFATGITLIVIGVLALGPSWGSSVIAISVGAAIMHKIFEQATMTTTNKTDLQTSLNFFKHNISTDNQNSNEPAQPGHKNSP